MKQFFSYFMRKNHKTITPLCYGKEWDDFQYRMNGELDRIKSEQKVSKSYLLDNQTWEKTNE